MRVRRGPDHRVHQPRRHVRPDVRLHQGEPLVPLPRPVHLRIPRPRPVRRRVGCTGDRRIDQRARPDHTATCLEQSVDLQEEGGGQVVALEEVAEAQDGRGVRDAGGAGVDARKLPVDRDVVQRFLGGLVGEREPVLQEVDPQQHEDWVRRASRSPCRGEGDNLGDKGVPRDDGEHLLEEGLPARALGGSFETVREAQLVHAIMISGQASAPLPYAVNP